MTTSTGDRTSFGLNRWIFFAFAALIVMVGLLSIAGYLGNLHQYLDVTNAFKPQYLIAAIAAWVYFFLTQRPQWAVVSVVCIFLNCIEVLPWYIPQGMTTETPPQIVRILAFNVLAKNSEYDQVVSWVQKEKPDIAIFMEASQEWPEQLKTLENIFAYHVNAEPIDMQIYSTLPLANSNLKTYGKNRGYVISDINQGASISLIASHSYPSIVFGNEGFTWRNEQLQAIGDAVKNQDNPVIVVGDLNAPMWSRYYQSAFNGSGLRNTRQGFGVMPTYEPKNFFKAIPVDHCLVSEDIQVVNMRLGPSLGSDHVPIIVDLLIPNFEKNQPEIKPAITL